MPPTDEQTSAAADAVLTERPELAREDVASVVRAAWPHIARMVLLTAAEDARATVPGDPVTRGGHRMIADYLRDLADGEAP
ncbi:MAG TPA: hypothetical protein VKZ89_20180 [Thermobifida alba]|nr:hypothetical protein [Thermobifida alba]